MDVFTIENEPIDSIDLMERASKALAAKIMERWDSNTPVKVFAGPGNNGGDALAVARMLSLSGYYVSVYLFNTSGTLSADCMKNKQRLETCRNVELTEVTSSFAPPKLEAGDVVVDGLFGTGISRPLNGGFASVVKYINASPSVVVSIDVPSGLMCEDNTYNVMNHIVRADYTFTFQYPKLAFFFADNERFVGHWEVLDIGIKDPETEMTDTPYYYMEERNVAGMLKVRSKFAHKGTAGHAVLVAGKRGMAGAAVLASRACMRSGVGKLTVHTPEANVNIMQISVPEAILDIEPGTDCFSNTFDANDYDALGIGPGIGVASETVQAFIEQLRLTKSPVIIDADGLNILGSHRGWILQLPKKSILTPHKKELFGLISTTRNCYEELERTRELAVRQQIYVVIKGAYSAIVTPEGKVWFNSTGNPGMATAGSGDVLTGIILSLLAQDYGQENAVRLGVYLHGLAGDIAACELGEDSLVASDIIAALPKAFRKLHQAKND
ncbi:MAG: NAD(P)H-hydrate dehydratase [Roseburia sp.]|nr:NAD(P)H-hydrate dehydratase [Roseburia sp.]